MSINVNKSACNAQNPLGMFRHNFPVGGEVANLLRTCYRHGKLSWHDNTSATSPQQISNKSF